MDNSFVEEVAASLVREFLSRKGLKKTIATMDREFPRSALSINNRNELRNVLHLHSLYKQNKAKENPLKTLLEIITNYFLEHVRTSRTITSSSALTNPQSKSSSVQLPNYSDEEHMHQSTIMSDVSKTEDYRYDVEDPLDKILPSRKHQHKSERCHTGTIHNTHSLSDGDKKLKDSREDLKAMSSEELKATVKEKQRSRSGLIVRGMMAGPIASSPEDLQKRRLSKRSISISSTGQFKGEEHEKNDLSVPSTDFQEGKGSSTQSTSFFSSHGDSDLKGNTEFFSKTLSSSHTSSASEKLKNFPKDTDDAFGKLLSERERTKAEERKSIPGFDTDSNEKSLKVIAPHRHSGTGREKRERSLKKNESRLSGHRKTLASACNKEEPMKDVLELVDVEDEATAAEVSKIPDLSTLYTFQVASKAIDISLAKEIKNLLFGSSLCCFSEEWKIQSFTFNNIPQLKYGIVQKKGGPCGVLAAVQACVLQQLIFGDSNRNKDTRVRNDFDVLTNRLIGSHGYCTQELVNLLLTGKAVSNVFNNVIELDSGNGNITILKGITSRSDIGLLSLFEHYDVCQVGCYLKTPKYPIWLVCSESHFSVLFCLEKNLLDDWKTEQRFDLYYYDGLANQEEEIRLTVDATQMCTEAKDNDLTPPLEHCIRTKWHGAVIDWNGTEPIL
ncbi:probable ubiquitin carboxyl-terminal hydrolase MINDY-4 isoform X5 [Dromaius novaehollandiae]|uniref:probable ubiquitin carboxyl-terminal hydrolase MINDY-4 isoform X5 n=1 Tax=Dromaius novaehollandiae TaxID=8790 RepID=UPI00311F5CED